MDSRVHFHVFVGPDLRNGIGFEWNPELKTVKGDEVIWRGNYPNVTASRPQRKSWNEIYQAAISDATQKFSKFTAACGQQRYCRKCEKVFAIVDKSYPIHVVCDVELFKKVASSWSGKRPVESSM